MMYKEDPDLRGKYHSLGLDPGLYTERESELRTGMLTLTASLSLLFPVDRMWTAFSAAMDSALELLAETIPFSLKLFLSGSLITLSLSNREKH